MIPSPRALLSFVVTLSLLACSTHEPRRGGTIPTHGAGERSATSALFVHFGIGFGDTKRLLSARVHLGEPFDVAGEDFWHLTGRIDSRGNEIVAELMGSTGWQCGPYKGPVKLEEPFSSQGIFASGGATHMWFGVSTNSDPTPLIDQINEQYRRATEAAGKDEGGPANGSQPIRSESNGTPSAAGSRR